MRGHRLSDGPADSIASLLSDHSAPAILFEDAHLLAVNKPPGLLSQGESTGAPNVVDWARGYLGRPYVGLLHRLDRNVSGVLLLAKRSKAAERLTRALQEGTLRRTYRAWLVGRLEAPAHWRHRLLKDERTNVVRVVAPGTPGGRDAGLRVEPVGRGRFDGLELTEVELRLETGRGHQIRVQAAAMGLPLLGDPKYGRLPKASDDARSRAFGRPALHSALAEFDHPIAPHAPLRIAAPEPEDFARVTR